MIIVESTILIFSATSEIAQKVTENFAKENTKVLLHGRNAEKLKLVKEEIISNKEISKSNIIILPPFDFINPKKDLDIYSKEDNDKEMFKKWFSHVAETNGLPATILIATGGMTEKLEDYSFFNSTVPIRCMTNFIDLIKSCSIENQKKNKFKIAFLNSVSSDVLITGGMEIYASSKRIVTEFIDKVKKDEKDITFQNIKLGPIKTSLLKNGVSSGWPSWLQFFAADIDITAKKIKDAVKSSVEELYIPGFWYYAMMFTPMSGKSLLGLGLIASVVALIGILGVFLV